MERLLATPATNPIFPASKFIARTIQRDKANCQVARNRLYVLQIPMTFSIATFPKRWIAFAAFAVCCLGLGGQLLGAGQYFKVDYPAASNTNGLQIAVAYTLWVPDGALRLRAIIVHQHGAGTTASEEGSTA